MDLEAFGWLLTDEGQGVLATAVAVVAQAVERELLHGHAPPAPDPARDAAWQRALARREVGRAPVRRDGSDLNGHWLALPEAATVSDASMLGALADGIVLVVRLGSTPRTSNQT